MSNEIVVSTTNQTPIEIALGIDEQGRTTARKLYEFLGLHSAHYSRWCKKNIVKNQFAEENIDYWGFDINVDGIENSPLMVSLSKQAKTGRGNTTDYKLTSSFAKKLAMASGSPRGEEAREYFLRTEEALKQVVVSHRPDELAQLKAQSYDLLMQNRELEQRIGVLEQKLLTHQNQPDTRELLAECLQDISRALMGNATVVTPKENTNNHPITESQLNSIRMAVQECVSNQVRILETRYFSIPSRASSGVCRILQNNIYNTIKDTIGTRHTKADRSQYGEIMQIVSEYEMDVELLERIRRYVRQWEDK